ncbi:hypothetical protein [Paraburkholderia tagetis]|uniref:Uncharacterized protein n=1 Tax=Paraburkholderia tagetis TaxID=2913261 RepID=A0A9X1RST1_9BURK|nr:hypothetical protein [Paraburkholderia tagetis]MCG5076663.1 hypothetical protein [Paraburkholderia tagetis]
MSTLFVYDDTFPIKAAVAMPWRADLKSRYGAKRMLMTPSRVKAFARDCYVRRWIATRIVVCLVPGKNTGDTAALPSELLCYECMAGIVMANYLGVAS